MIVGCDLMILGTNILGSKILEAGAVRQPNEMDIVELFFILNGYSKTCILMMWRICYIRFEIDGFFNIVDGCIDKRTDRLDALHIFDFLFGVYFFAVFNFWMGARDAK